MAGGCWAACASAQLVLLAKRCVSHRKKRDLYVNKLLSSFLGVKL